MLKNCGIFSTRIDLFLNRFFNYVYSFKVFNILSKIDSQKYPQQKILTLPLFEYIFYPISTGPIITKTKLKKGLI